MSTTTSGSSCTARDSASPSSIRPSASVLAISTVDPLCIVMTSPGRVAVPDTMFSAIGANAVTLTGRPSRAIARVAATTLAAPAMSPFMLTMLEDGLMVRPPESKVTPLPTSARCATASCGAQVSLTRRDGASEESPTLRMPPHPISASCSWSNTSSFTLGAPRPLVTSLCAAVTSVGQQRGRAVARRRVDPVAGQCDGVGEDLRALEGGDGVGLARDRGEHDDVVGLGGLGLRGLVGGERVAAEAVALDDGGDQLGGVARQGEGDRGGVGDVAGGDARGTAYGDGVGRVLAEADEHQQRGVDLVARRRPDRLAGLAGHAHRGEEGAQPAAVRRADVRGGVAQPWTLRAGDHSHDDGVGSGLGGAGAAKGVGGHPRHVRRDLTQLLLR